MVEKKALLVISVVVLLLLLVMVAGYGGIGRFTTTPSERRTTSSSTSAWQVISRNMTVCGFAASSSVVYGFDLQSITAPSETCIIKFNADRISYQGNYYYSGNYTYTTQNQTQITHTIWQTDYAIYCIRPKVEGYNICPTQP